MTTELQVTPVAAPIVVTQSNAGTPTAVGAPAVPPTPPAPLASTPAKPAEDEKPSWLDARLERERRSVLKDLGVESIEDAKKAIDELMAKREAEKTAAQKAAELDASLKATKAEKDALAEQIAVYAKAKLDALTDEQKAAVIALAGDDAAKQLKTIDALSSTWKSAAPAAASAPVVVDTAPAPAAPNGVTPTSQPDPKAIHAELAKTNPVIAARYAKANGLLDL